MSDAPTDGGATLDKTAVRKQSIEAVPVRHPGRWVAVAVLAVLGAMFVNTVLTNDGFRWSIVGRYLFAEPVLNGLRNTLILTALSMIIGIVGGIALAVMRLSPNPVLSGVAWVYIWFFRGTPLIVQLLFWILPGRALPDALPRHPVRARARVLRHQPLITQFTAALLGAGAERGGLHGRDRAGGHRCRSTRARPRRPSALGMSRLPDACAGSCCRRPCG